MKQSPEQTQRSVAKWLELVLGELERTGVVPVKVAGAAINVVDALRSPLLIQGALALDRLSRISEVLSQRQPRVLHWRDDDGLRPSVAKLAALLPEKTGSVLARARARWIATRGYYAKRWHEFSVPAERWQPETRAESPVLLLPREPGHLSDLLPVASILRDRHGVPCVFLAMARDQADRIRASGFDCALIPALEPLAPAQAEPVLRAVLAANQGLAGSPELAGRTGLAPEQVRALHLVLAEVCQVNLPELMRVSRAVQQFVKRRPPRLVLVGNPYTYEGRTAAMTAQDLGVPVATLEHGSIFPGDPLWNRCPVDLVCAWGESSAQALQASGVPQERIVVTGAPRTDAVLSSFASVAQDEAQAIALVATSGPGDLVSLPEHLGFIEALYQAASRLPQIPFVVKLHPKDRPAHYDAAAARYPGARVQVIASNRARLGNDIYDYLARARLLITISSTSAVDAMLVRVPVVNFRLGGEQRFQQVEYLASGCTLPAADAVDLAATVQACWQQGSDPAIAEAAGRYAKRHFANPGQAAAATIAALRSLEKIP